MVVYWRDIQSHQAWCDGWDSELQPADCIDVGWIREFDGYIQLIRSIDATNSAIGDVTAIPTGCIRAILPLIEPAQPDS